VAGETSFVSAFGVVVDVSPPPSACLSSGSGVKKFPSSPVRPAFALALASLFALALSPPFTNISRAARAFRSASSFAILSKSFILSIRS